MTSTEFSTLDPPRVQMNRKLALSLYTKELKISQFTSKEDKLEKFFSRLLFSITQTKLRRIKCARTGNFFTGSLFRW
ncbi:MAG TPA: hypothetical protein DCL41_03580 [Bdellovibrionales bacterium]|nr:hypothetical protein [Pseudobdellovibrionaceae bacterium]HAG90922.1 hypothetical protein [Bdellovibrionales bacterium]